MRVRIPLDGMGILRFAGDRRRPAQNERSRTGYGAAMKARRSKTV